MEADGLFPTPPVLHKLFATQVTQNLAHCKQRNPSGILYMAELST